MAPVQHWIPPMQYSQYTPPLPTYNYLPTTPPVQSAAMLTQKMTDMYNNMAYNSEMFNKLMFNHAKLMFNPAKMMFNPQLPIHDPTKLAYLSSLPNL